MTLKTAKVARASVARLSSTITLIVATTISITIRLILFLPARSVLVIKLNKIGRECVIASIIVAVKTLIE